MIRFTIEDADIEPCPHADCGYTHTVNHPSNGAILAYCDSEQEAKDAREAINDLARQLRGVGHKVA